MSCSICCDDYNLKNRVKKTCCYCEFEACNKCIQTYLIGSMNDPHCMSCRKAWDIEILDTMVHKNFRLIEYKKHRETVLYDIEKSLLPQTQPYVHIELQKRHYKEVNRDLRNRIKDLERECNTYRNTYINVRREIFTNRNNPIVCVRLTNQKNELDEKISTIKRNSYEIHRLILDNYRTVRNIRNNGIPEDDNTNTTSVVKKKNPFIIHCPRDTCKGFIGGDQWSCGVCQYFSCEKCHEIIGESKDIPHECKPENIETAKLLKKEAKSCPGCSTLIYRISGCSQMWCTQCHTAFNWNTGTIETGTVHNPHFYEYQRTNTNYIVRNQGEEVCGGARVSVRILLRFLAGDIALNPLKDTIYTTHRKLIHIQQIEMPRYNVQFFVNTNIDLRVKYLLNEVTEHNFKRKLQIAEKSKNKKREIYLILEMYVQTTHDMFRNLVDTPHTDSNHHNEIMTDWIKQIATLQEYANQHFQKISHRYNCVAPNFTTTGGFETIRY